MEVKIFYNFDKFINRYINNSTRIMYHDCETLKYNLKSKNTREHKSIEYSVCFGFLDDNNNICVIVINNYYDFFNKISKIQRHLTIKLTAHNANKFDNHFILQTLKTMGYSETPKQNDKYTDKLHNYINSLMLENELNYVESARIKSRANLELKFTINNVDIETADTYPRTNEALFMICDRLYKYPDIIDSKYLKLDGYDYNAYDLIDEFLPLNYTYHIYVNLSGFNFQYQINDVISMIAYYENYETFFPLFDRKKPSIASNVLHYFIKERPETRKILTMPLMNYSDYEYKKGISLFQHFNKSYSAGCNFYNDNYLGKVIKNDIVSLDLNSSFIRPIYDSYLPLKPSNYFPAKNFLIDDIKNLSEKTFFICNIKIIDFNEVFINSQRSLLIGKIFTKYFKSNIENDSIVLTSVNLKIMSKFLTDLSLTKIVELQDIIYFETEIFKGADIIAQNYRTKQQGKNKYILDMDDVLNIKVTNEINNYIVNENEYAISKIINNALYGSPALRNFFNVFVVDENNEYINFNKGLENAERNILFSLAITAYSFYNLLEPLSTIEHQSFIDDNLFYGDTDSLYLTRFLFNMMNINLDKNNLGAWDIEHDDIDMIYISNHKRYSYVTKSEPNDFIVKSGGIRQSAFNHDKGMSFKEFTNNYLSDGAMVTNTNSLLTESGVPIIYEYETEIKQGFEYSIGIDLKSQEIKERYIKEIINRKEEYTNAIYYDTPQGVITQREIAEYAEPTKKDYTLTLIDYLMKGLEI